MSEKLESYGKCLFCGKTYKQQGINRHLSTHLKEMEEAKDGKKGTSYLVYANANEMFLSLWVDSNTSFDKLDSFLRAIWLQCCGHMSSFTDNSGHYAKQGGNKNLSVFDLFDDYNPNEVPKNMKISKVYRKNKKLTYDYDFGSTTRFKIEFKNEYKIAPDEPIILLSRNEPLKIMCHVCGKYPAKHICTVHLWDGTGMLCDKCSKTHKKECEDYADYAYLPVVNSPRMGTCAYEGGSIDIERDGVYVGE